MAEDIVYEIRLSINGMEVTGRDGMTILEAAQSVGIEIPTLCHSPDLAPTGNCRVCVVELEGARTLVGACHTPITDGMVIKTNSPTVVMARKATIELLMASAAHVPLIRAMAEELGVTEPRFTMEPDDCILCGLCVRACEEIVGVGAISVINRGIEKEVSPPFSIASKACIGCGTCVLVCPTGAITLDDITGGAQTVHRWVSEYEAVNCQICGHQGLTPRFADHVTLLAEEEAVP